MNHDITTIIDKERCTGDTGDVLDLLTYNIIFAKGYLKNKFVELVIGTPSGQAANQEDISKKSGLQFAIKVKMVSHIMGLICTIRLSKSAGILRLRIVQRQPEDEMPKCEVIFVEP